MSSVTRTVPLRPFACRETKTGTSIDLYDVLEELRNDATLCAEEALKHAEGWVLNFLLGNL